MVSCELFNTVFEADLFQILVGLPTEFKMLKTFAPLKKLPSEYSFVNLGVFEQYQHFEVVLNRLILENRAQDLIAYLRVQKHLDIGQIQSDESRSSHENLS